MKNNASALDRFKHAFGNELRSRRNRFNEHPGGCNRGNELRSGNCYSEHPGRCSHGNKQLPPVASTPAAPNEHASQTALTIDDDDIELTEAGQSCLRTLLIYVKAVLDYFYVDFPKCRKVFLSFQTGASKGVFTTTGFRFPIPLALSLLALSSPSSHSPPRRLP
jgi:hypothetical protein